MTLEMEAAALVDSVVDLVSAEAEHAEVVVAMEVTAVAELEEIEAVAAVVVVKEKKASGSQ